MRSNRTLVPANAVTCLQIVRPAIYCSTVAISLLAFAGCQNVDDSVSVEQAALNGTLVPDGGPLTRTSSVISPPDPTEVYRELGALSYYQSIDPSGLGDHSMGLSLSTSCSNLAKFTSFYGFGGSNEVTTYYYNRGDLGLGREMHCVNNLGAGIPTQIQGTIACYVKNYAAGDAGSEFTFGLSSTIAFTNLESGVAGGKTAFATVAMVFRKNMVSATDRTFFAVYAGDAVGASLQDFAALDRHGINFESAWGGFGPNPNPSFGTPGVTLNNHVPTNCISCHGGTGVQEAAVDQVSVTNALFLPFDLDNLDYETTPNRTRAYQTGNFEAQNKDVLAVAQSTSGGTSIVNQLNLWYANFTKDFDGSVVPMGWTVAGGASAGATAAYQSFFRRSCRTCHVALQYTFDSESLFTPLIPKAVLDVCWYQMPHSLQASRQFWQSTAPVDFVTYLRGLGRPEANTLAGCGPGNVITLDPPQIQASLAGLL
jgi:mono/diheme cytochrome c family protein